MDTNLFFNPRFRMEFDWKGKYHLAVGSVLPHNKKQISDGIRDMSPETIRQRFLGSKREFSDKELQYLTVLDGWNHYAIGVEERDKLKRGVAIIRMVRSSHSETEAEIAITIIDDYQRKGLGSFLLNLIMLAAMERKIETLSFTFLPQNVAIVKLIKGAGIPIAGPHNQDYVQLFIDLKSIDPEKLKAQLATTLPGIDTFHLKT
jgi:GNAT superfamily N-acetyltransferase